MSKTMMEEQLIPRIDDTPENVAKALMNPSNNSVITSKRSVKTKRRKKSKRVRK